jgi:hypothetical protein
MSAPSLRDRIETLTFWSAGDGLCAVYRHEAGEIAASGDATIAALRDEVAEAKADYMRACRLVANMHAAATGRPGEGPVRGVVEDVTDAIAAQAARIVDLLREIEQRRLDWDKERTAFVVKAWEQAARIAELERANEALAAALKQTPAYVSCETAINIQRRRADAAEAEVAWLSAPVGVEPVAYRYQGYSPFARAQDGGGYRQLEGWQFIPTPMHMDAHSSSCGAVAEPLLPESAIRTLQARLAADGRDDFMRYAKQMDCRDFEETSEDGIRRFTNPFTQGKWDYWRASRDAARSSGTGEAGA